MDFGDILDAWERSGGGPSLETRRGRKEKAGKPRENPLAEWLRTNPVYDKDAEPETVEAPPGQRRHRLLAKRADACLDLHGLSQSEAWDALESFFQESRRRGLEKLLIVHGKGNHSEGESVLRRTCRIFIERCSFAGESGYAPRRSGGTGATWVMLKQESGEGGASFRLGATVPGR